MVSCWKSSPAGASTRAAVPSHAGRLSFDAAFISEKCTHIHHKHELVCLPPRWILTPVGWSTVTFLLLNSCYGESELHWRRPFIVAVHTLASEWTHSECRCPRWISRCPDSYSVIKPPVRPNTVKTMNAKSLIHQHTNNSAFLQIPNNITTIRRQTASYCSSTS